MIKSNQIYRHYKGKLYIVLHLALHTETEEKLVIYQRQGESQVYARPYDMFSGYLEDGRKRFTLVEG